MALEIGDDDDSSAGGLDLFPADDLTGLPIAALDQNVGEEGGNDSLRSFLGEKRQIIDIFDSAEDFEALLEREHRPRRPLDLPDRSVGIERYNQHITQTFSLPKKFDVPAMNKIKAAVSKDHLLPLPAQSGANLS